MQLMRALIPLKIKWASQVSITTDEEIFALAAESGCMFVFPGFESLTPDNLTFLDKPQNIVEKYPEMIEKLHKHNIGVAGFFIVGLPHDNKDVFKNLFLFSEKNNIEVILISLFQPTPGTKQYLNWEERNTYKNYQSIINDLPVFLPKGMSKKEFKKEFVDFYRLVLSDESIDKRLERCKNPGLYFWNKAMQEDYNQSLMDDWAEGKQNLSR